MKACAGVLGNEAKIRRPALFTVKRCGATSDVAVRRRLSRCGFSQLLVDVDGFDGGASNESGL